MSRAPARPIIHTGSKELYKQLLDQRPDLFPRQYILFQIAAAIGIAMNARQPILPADEERIIDRRTTDAFPQYGVFDSILWIQHPDTSEKDRLAILEEFAEHGIHVIHEQVTKTGTFDIAQYL